MRSLAPADRTLLRLIACGRRDPEIARGIARSPWTVRYRIRNLQIALGVRGRVMLAMEAVRLGIVTPEQAVSDWTARRRPTASSRARAV